MTTNAVTDSETGLRYYRWQGLDYPSVTSVRRLVGMPFTLHNWVLSQVIDRAIVGHETIGDMLTRPKKPRERVRDTNVLKEVRAYLRAAATEERDRAGDKGTRAHDSISVGLALDQVDADVVGHVGQFYDAVQTLGATVLWSERQMFNLSYGYAGTGDALWRMPNGRIFVVDYKTSKGVYLDHAVQLIAYAMAEFVGENDKVDAAATDLLRQADGLGILHLSEHQWEWIEVSPEQALFEGFIGSLAFAKFLSRYDNKIDPLVSRRQIGGTLVPALARGLHLVKEAQQ